MNFPPTYGLHAITKAFPYLVGWLSLIIGLPITTWAQTKSSFWRKLHPDSLTNRPLRFIPLPVLQSGPEIGLKGGLSLDYFFNAATIGAKRPHLRSRYWHRLDSASRQTRNSYVFVQGLYSTRRQLTLEGVWQTYGVGERYILRGRGGYLDFAEDYWGVGNQTVGERDYLVFTYQRWYVQHRMWRKIKGHLFAGFSYNYSDTRNLRSDNAVTFVQSEPGYQGSVISGIGPTLLADYRNNPFSPTRGWYAEWAMHIYRAGLGSQYRYTEHLLDLRRYWPLPGRHWLGAQALGHFTTGQVPLRELPRLGGPAMMRGFVQGRYRDQQLWSMQLEYRYTLGPLLKAAAFGAVGGVAPTLRQWQGNYTRYATGVGLRLLVNRPKEIYLRADLAFNSNGTTNLYLRMLDAF
ncbi:BamA/TamA family outer membrane protein [Larkinella sp. GY13]|uniref:BamA/TamA family outer membrane protein n=1 Tax=Larkinella sp. GY13 TaxID=3453720 RepID=UPI003EE87560